MRRDRSFLIFPLLRNGSLGGLILLQMVHLNCPLVGTSDHWTNGARPVSEDVLDASLVVHVATSGVLHGFLHLHLTDGTSGANLCLGHCEVIVNILCLRLVIFVIENAVEFLNQRVILNILLNVVVTILTLHLVELFLNIIGPVSHLHLGEPGLESP